MRRRSTARTSPVPHRAEHQDPAGAGSIPLHWIAEDGLIPTRRNDRDVKIPGVSRRLAELKWERQWLCGWSDVTASTNERTAIPAFLPRVAVGHTFPLMFPRVSAILAAALIATQSSLVFDFVSRQKISDAHEGVHLEAVARPRPCHAGTAYGLPRLPASLNSSTPPTT